MNQINKLYRVIQRQQTQLRRGIIRKENEITILFKLQQQQFQIIIIIIIVRIMLVIIIIKIITIIIE